MLLHIFQSLQGFPEDFARSLGKDATLTNALQMLDEHYGMVMTFDALSKELYSLQQGSGENVAEFRVCMSQQVQLLQLEYSGRIQQKHMEEMIWDHSYEGLNPKYWHMLAHNINGKHPASYSDLLLVAWKLERWTEARDPLLPKTTITRGSNVTQPQASGNLFPSRKLKGNHTFTAQSAVVGSVGTEEDSSVKLEGEEAAESSEAEDQETPNEIGRADQPISYIICFANAVKLYQKKTKLFQVWQSWPSGEGLSKESQQGHQESEFKCKRRDDNPSETGSHSTGIPRWGPQSLKTSKKIPSWTLTHWISGVDWKA